MSDSLTPWTLACQAPLSFIISWSLPKFMPIESVVLSNCLTLCHPFSFCLQSFFSIRIFSNESALCMSWSKYWSFSCSTRPSKKYSRLISFINQLNSLIYLKSKSLLQHHNWLSAFFMIQLSPTHLTTGKAIAWPLRTFFTKAMSLFFSMISSFSSKEQVSFFFFF